jgi:hypothetical protein
MSMIEKLPRDHYKNIEKLKSLIDDSRIKLISPTRNRIPALRKDRRTAGTQDRHMAMLQQAELAPDRLEQEPSGALLSSKSTSPAEKIRSGNLRQKIEEIRSEH